MAMNGSGIRDTARVLGISTTTIMSHLKKLNPPKVTPIPFDQVTDIKLVCEMDEQWSLVQNKQQQRWLWYAWSPQFKRILAYALGDRTDETCKQLLELLRPFTFSVYCTDDWGVYSRLLPWENHLIGEYIRRHSE